MQNCFINIFIDLKIEAGFIFKKTGHFPWYDSPAPLLYKTIFTATALLYETSERVMSSSKRSFYATEIHRANTEIHQELFCASP
jgi:hypothetical protein